MTAEELYDIVIDKAKEFGMVPKNNFSSIVEARGNAIIRKNISAEAYTNGTAFFSIISEEEETSGPFSDFSFTVFPEQEVGACVVTLGVGSSGFKNDYQLASLPGLRRSFLKLSTNDSQTFFKTSFDDIETTASDLVKEIRSNHPNLKQVIESYKTVLPAARIIDFNNVGSLFSPFEDENACLETIFMWLATYAKIRDWGTRAQKELVEQTLSSIPTPPAPNEKEDIRDLLQNRKYVVLQGAPGTGKTWNALGISADYNKTFFEQFHAETSYSDFVCGLEPNLNAAPGQPQFRMKKGVLCQAMEYAKDNGGQKVLLIIDEINRANLSNVLGPVFYLFENQAGTRTVPITIGGREYTKLPENLHVIATMNTADRSLAVVDFALRRRFAWYTLRPHVLPGRDFDKKMFQKFADIFFEYATDDELNLQPGQSYFNDKANMKDRMIYELMPLIKEYLAEGYMLKAKDAFCDLFLKETGKLMYE